ncbi:unnamed protein product [Rotaria socialis]|uniref:NAD(P)(+)--arginine ADP-ribosyltransferase n=1 Tax=Rotaria socialis TaxID=392032 RepID=A0A821NHN8_9BILA|nr:unnamed protein product [Rotaria socialis]CAF4784880.1 unnamed protein product [Rotaria socialis]
MGNKVSPSEDSSTRMEWMWRSNSDPLCESQVAEWKRFSDVENLIIEEAFKAKQSEVLLDDFCIDFKQSVQISTNDKSSQRCIKRQVNKRDNTNLREDRFMPDPISPKRSFGGQYGWISPFIQETLIYLGLEDVTLPSQDDPIIPIIVEKAALGIIEEGNTLGYHSVAEWMAKELINQKDKGMKEVWICCARLYSMEEFLYKKLNEIMRLIGNQNHEEVWRSKVPTLGPVCFLLWNDPINKSPNTTRKILYRAANLSNAQLDNYCELSQNPDQYRSFQAFTSCSRNRASAERFGSTLFIMEVEYAFTADIQRFSKYPEEEEELLFPAVCFTVKRVEYDKTKNQNLIYIILKQRFDGEYELTLSNVP